jgi:CBS domain-containing protein
MMKVSDLLRMKQSNVLYTVQPDQPLADALSTMAEKDIGSLVVMEQGELAGMLSFREVIAAIAENARRVEGLIVRNVMQPYPLTCTPETKIDHVRQLMLEHHARYLPVIQGTALLGVISLYDVAKAVVQAQCLENRMLKAYIQDCPLQAIETDEFSE